MFEQSLYDMEPVEPPQEGDLFNKYEIKNWELGPRVYKILGISALGNMIALLIVAQTSLLTMKGCDSPLVGSVCQVLDTVYVGSMLFGTDRRYVDQAYEKTDLSNADITFIDVTGGKYEPLYYPSDYLKYSDPERYELQQQQQQANDPMLAGLPPGYLAPGIPMSKPFPGSSMFNTKPITPKPNNDVIDGDLPGSPGDSGISSNPKGRKNFGGGKVTKVPQTKPGEVAPGIPDTNPKVDPTDPTKAVVLNTKPLKDFGKGVADQSDKKEIDLSSNFTVVSIGELTQDGKLDTSIDKRTKLRKSRIISASGDPKMIAVVGHAIEAVSDSGFLKYLQQAGITKVNFVFTQNNDQLVATITADQVSPERAKTISSGLNGLIGGTLIAVKAGAKKLSDDEVTLLNFASTTTNGKQVVLNFAIPKPVAQEMIQRNIQKAREAETGGKPNGKLTETATDNSAGK